ncbi:unnamed protein product [Arctia plantaginis]|uniref:Uncharacterized protein n=1 Tax=Arctia plantaginis TaxID=874455 RepID=A0A8S0Z609_ARCPL|nr:unnamed protein product [Arctia plantaginis]
MGISRIIKLFYITIKCYIYSPSYRSIRKRRSAAIVKFLEDQDIAKFRKSPSRKPRKSRHVSQSEELPEQLSPDQTCKDSPDIDMPEDLTIPSRSTEQLPTLARSKTKKPSVRSRRKKNTKKKVPDVSTPTTDKNTTSKETQTDLVMTDAHENLLRLIMSQNMDTPNRMWANDDYFTNYTNPAESNSTKMFNDHEIAGFMSLFEQQAILSMLAMSQQHQFNPINPNLNRCTITEIKDNDELWQKQDLQIEELPVSNVEQTQQNKQATNKSSTGKGSRNRVEAETELEVNDLDSSELDNCHYKKTPIVHKCIKFIPFNWKDL